MSDNLKLVGEPDRSLVSLLEPWEVNYVAEKYNVPKEVVVAAAQFLQTRTRDGIEALIAQHYPRVPRNELKSLLDPYIPPAPQSNSIGMVSGILGIPPRRPGLLESIALQHPKR